MEVTGFDAASFRQALKEELDAIDDDELVALLREGFADAVRERAKELAVFACAQRLEKLVSARGDEIVNDAVLGSARASQALREAARGLARRLAREAVDRALR